MIKRRRMVVKSDVAIVMLLLAGLIAMPIAMIGCAILENRLFGTNYLEQIAQFLGLHEPMEKLYKALQPVLGW